MLDVSVELHHVRIIVYIHMYVYLILQVRERLRDHPKVEDLLKP